MIDLHAARSEDLPEERERTAGQRRRREQDHRLEHQRRPQQARRETMSLQGRHARPGAATAARSSPRSSRPARPAASAGRSASDARRPPNAGVELARVALARGLDAQRGRTLRRARPRVAAAAGRRRRRRAGVTCSAATAAALPRGGEVRGVDHDRPPDHPKLVVIAATRTRSGCGVGSVTTSPIAGAEVVGDGPRQRHPAALAATAGSSPCPSPSMICSSGQRRGRCRRGPDHPGPPRADVDEAGSVGVDAPHPLRAASGARGRRARRTAWCRRPRRRRAA